MAEAEESLVSVVVGIDLGSTFSGFAFAHKDKPDEIYTLYEWPGQEGRQYCKTHTGLFYVKQKAASGREEYELTHWGWPALAQHLKGGSGSGDGVYLTDFKQHLAAPEAAGHLPETPSRIVSGLEMGWTGSNRRHRMAGAGTKTERDGRGGGFPEGLSVVRATADFLREISTLALKHVRETWGGHITGRDVQWCLTVPAIWEDSAKQIMRRCAEMAGLMEGPGCPRHLANTASPHPVRILLESEAASIYCSQARLRRPNLRSGAEIMVAEIEEETTEINVHVYTKSNDGEEESELKERVQSSGALCGGTHVDANFFHFLRAVISGFDEVERQNAAAMAALKSRWSDLKMSFDGSRHRGPHTLAIPTEVTNSSKFYDTKGSEDRVYDGEMELTVSDMKQIFDPVVDRIIELLREAITPRLKLLVLAGSFSTSPYLQDRLKGALVDTLGNVVMPPEAFSSMFEDAVAFLFSLDLVISKEESTSETRSSQLNLENGDEFMVADIGGGTTDIVVHMFTTDDDSDEAELELRETVQSSGGLCGGTDVDANFFRFLRDRISGFGEVESQNPAAMTALQWSWSDLKTSFDGSQDWGPRSLAIPKAVTKTWNFYDTKGSGDREYHGRMELTVSDMKEIFDPVVDRIIGLIREAITPGLKQLLLVGGFSASPYLRARVKEELAGTLEAEIRLPPEPGSVVCEGAVFFGFFPDLVVSGSEDLVISALEEAAKAVKIRLVNFANAVIDRGYADRLSFPRHERHSFQDIDFMDPEFASKRRGMRYRTAYVISTLMFRGLDREDGASNSFKEFQALKHKSSNPSFIDEVMEVVEADAPDDGNRFHQFVWQKFRDMIPDNLLKEACGLPDILRRFVLLAIAVWQLQRLALSFPRNAKILVPCGANFDERYMVRIADNGEEKEAHTGPLKVGFMVVPGFRLGKIIVKSQVYIT